MPYPYTLMPDGHTMEDEVKPPAETQEESTRPNSPFQDFGNPSLSPSSPSSSQLPAPPPGGSQPSQSPHDYADGPGSQSSGQASSSKSDEQGSKGSSQDEDSTDANKAKDETRAQVVLRDIAEVQDDFGTSWVFDGISPDHWHRYNNPDVIRVQQDMERRPLTFKRCFEQAESPRRALEFIYANCPVTDESELRHLEQVAKDQSDGRAGMAEGGTGDARNDVQETFTLDDVRKFTELDLANAALDEDKALHYEDMLNKVFGFKIQWGTNDGNKLNQLQNLAKANVHIVDYLDHVIETKQNQDSEITGLSIYQRNFSQTDTGPLKVWLGADSVLVKVFELEGADDKDAPYLGNVPLKASASGEELEKIYLGSEVNIATITHEFMHVLDRNTDITQEILNEWVHKTGVPPDDDIYKLVIKGFAAKQTVFAELWADVGMTAVLDLAADAIGKSYKVFSVKDTRIVDDEGKTKGWPYLDMLEIAEVFECSSVPGACAFRDVGWKDTGNRDEVEAYMIDLFWEKLILQHGETTDE